jgi:hypothetical protein
LQPDADAEKEHHEDEAQLGREADGAAVGERWHAELHRRILKTP